MQHLPAWLMAVLLGVVQGLTEFLPISSSAHLVLVPELGGAQYWGKGFDVALHFGTLLAVLGYFREDLRELGRAGLALLREGTSGSDPLRRTALYLLVGTLPAGVAGVLFEDVIEARFNAVGSIAAMLVVFALLLGWADRTGRRRRELSSLHLGEVLAIGMAQALALMPGVSRSGITMTAGLFLGLTREQAARFSFLLSIPVIAGAALFKARLLVTDASAAAALAEPVLLGMVSAGLTGFFCIHYLLRYLRSGSFFPFVVYRLALGAGLFVWLFR